MASWWFHSHLCLQWTVLCPWFQNHCLPLTPLSWAPVPTGNQIWISFTYLRFNMWKTELVIFPSSDPSSPFAKPIPQHSLSWETWPLSQTEKDIVLNTFFSLISYLHSLPRPVSPSISSFCPVICSTATILVQATDIFQLEHHRIPSSAPQAAIPTPLHSPCYTS